MFRQCILSGPLCVICINLQGITTLKLLFVLRLSVALKPPVFLFTPRQMMSPAQTEQTTGILKQAFMPLWSFF